MAGLDPRTLSGELEEAFDQRRRELARRLERLLERKRSVVFAGELVTPERAQARYRELRSAQLRTLLEVIGLYAAMGAGAWLLFKLVAAYCR